MVHTKAEDDDEESFGDFTFASFPNPTQITSQNSIMNNDDDDEWGDFVEFPLQSELSSGSSKTPPPSDAAAGPSKPFDPFGFFSDHSTATSKSAPTPTESVPNRAESEKSHWEKPKGALPLSIFGDVEQQEEEESGAVDLPVGDNKHAENVRNGSNMFLGLALNDIIGNLYNQNQQIKVENGLDSNSVGSNSNPIGTNQDLNGVNSNINGLASNSSALNSKSEFFSGNYDNQSGLSSNSDLFSGNIHSQNPQNKAVSGLNSNSDLFAGNNGSQSQQINSVSGLDLNKDLFSGNIGFEAFTSSYSQNQQNKAENSNRLNSNLFASNSNVNWSISNLDPLDGNEEFDGDDDGWEFKDAYTASEVGDSNGSLYNPSQLIKDENRAKSNMFGTNLNSNELNSDINGPVSNSSGLNSNSDLFAGKSDSQILRSRTVSGLSSNSDSIYGNSDSQHPQIKAVNGSNSNLDLFAGNNDSQGQQIKAISGLNFFSSGLDLNKDLFSRNIDFDAFSNLYSETYQNKDVNPKGLNSNLNADTSYHSCMDSNFDALVSNSDTPGRNDFDSDGDDDGWEFKDAYSNSDTPGRIEDFDGDGWEFKDAYSESRVGVGNDKVDGKEQGNPDGTGFSFEFANGSHESIDLFSASNWFSGKSTEAGISLDFKPLPVAQNGVSTDSVFNSIQHIDSEKRLNSDPVLATVDSHESFGDFETAFTGTESKQENETISRNHKEALPLSIFGDEELETDDSLRVQDTFTYTPSSHRNGIISQDSNIPITDLISNLYSQAEQIPSVGVKEKFSGNRLDSSDKVLNSELVNREDEFDDTSWEFKDASSQTVVEELTYPRGPGDANQNSLTKSKLNNHVDFYCKLKDELSFVCRCHLDSLKKAQNIAALSGEDAKVIAIEEEIQEACKELQEENMNSKESSEHQLPRDICLNEFLEVLRELKFQVLESEYHLSRRLNLAEKELRSAIELMKHTTSVLNVLTLGSVEDQYIYVSTWSKMIALCVQELKHGSWIWKQFIDKNLQSQMLSDPQGKQFVLALGEIYRVAVVLGASTKLYKPWILSSSVDSTSIYALLEECYSLWSRSGIEEALQGISDHIDFEYHSTVEALRNSIKYICDLDALALENRVFKQHVSVCQLSLLNSEAVLEIKMVSWSGKYYFLTLANLWANLISSDPPDLPYLHVGS